MKSVDNGLGNYVGGLLVGVAIMVVFIICKDVYYEPVEKRINEFEQACKSLGSTPESYDYMTVTCKNGAEVRP